MQTKEQMNRIKKIIKEKQQQQKNIITVSEEVANASSQKCIVNKINSIIIRTLAPTATTTFSNFYNSSGTVSGSGSSHPTLTDVLGLQPSVQPRYTRNSRNFKQNSCASTFAAAAAFTPMKHLTDLTESLQPPANDPILTISKTPPSRSSKI